MLILVNFKTYPEVLGERGLRLAKICELVSKRYKTNIAIAPQILDLSKISSSVKIPVFAQHVDLGEGGKNTGSVIAESLKRIGAKGSLLNHSEKKLEIKEIEKSVKILKKYKLVSICCAENLSEAKKIAKFNPDFIAYEEPSLIGSGRAISKVKPKSVKKFVEYLEKINPKIIPLCGAGISSAEDVRLALELGTKGVIIASAIVKSSNPKSLLSKIAKTVSKFNRF